LKDYKARLQELCEELAQKQYGKGYYELPDRIQASIWAQAEEQWKDEQAEECDRLVDDHKLNNPSFSFGCWGETYARFTIMDNCNNNKRSVRLH
jgi:hypothetical protein